MESIFTEDFLRKGTKVRFLILLIFLFLSCEKRVEGVYAMAFCERYTVYKDENLNFCWAERHLKVDSYAVRDSN